MNLLSPVARVVAWIGAGAILMRSWGRETFPEAQGLTQLKGHRSVGGMRASVYNAMPMAGVEALVQFMREFERKNG